MFEASSLLGGTRNAQRPRNDSLMPGAGLAVLSRNVARIRAWYDDVLSTWRAGTITSAQAAAALEGRVHVGHSAWHFALTDADPAVAIAMLACTRDGIRAGMLPRDSLLAGLLTRNGSTDDCLLAGWAAEVRTPWIDAMFAFLVDLRRDGWLSEADLLQALDATLDLPRGSTHPDSMRRWSGAARGAAARQLNTFERWMHRLVTEGAIDPRSAGPLLYAGTGRAPRSLWMGAALSPTTDIHAGLLGRAASRGYLDAHEHRRAAEVATLLAALIHQTRPRRARSTA